MTAVADHRRLTLLLLSMTTLTGLVDAVSFLRLGQVFVANMTGNVVLLAFALAGAPALSANRSMTALVGFLLGALVGGRLSARLARGGRRWLTAVMAVQTVLIAGAMSVSVHWLRDLPTAETTGLLDRAVAERTGPEHYVVISMLALAMGVQHSTARRLARPDIPTNVLTTTLTGLVADSRLAGGAGTGGPCRLLAPVTMFGGALLGAGLLLHIDLLAPLSAALALVVAGLIGATRIATPTRVADRIGP